MTTGVASYPRARLYIRDGSDDYWVTPVTVGDKQHSYHWMPDRVGHAAKVEELAKNFEE
jgi:hypothetical protein